MSYYVHDPVHDERDVLRIMRERRREDEHLEFKATFWTDKGDKEAPGREEAVKDVVAMMNALGGTILVGISESPDDRAAEFCPAFSMHRKREQLLDWLRKDVVPEQASRHVHVLELRVDGGGASHDVLAVNIEPWPFGPVALRVGQDRMSYRFPVRRDRETRHLAWEEIVERNDAARRAMYLRLTALAREPKRVVLASPVRVRVLTAETDARVGGVARGTLKGPVAPDHVVLHLACERKPIIDGLKSFAASISEDVRRQVEERQGGLNVLLELLGRGVQGTPECPLAVPLEFVSAAWQDAERADVVYITLSATACWDDGHWTLAP